MSNKGPGRRATFVLVTGVVVFVILAATTYTLCRLRTEAVDRHFETARMVARSFEEHLTQSFNVIHLTLAGIADEARHGEGLAAALHHAPYLRSLSRLDGQGRVAQSSDPRNLGRRVDHRAFLPPTDGPMAILRIGPPWSGRDVYDGQPTTPEHPADPDGPSLIPVLRDIDVDAGQGGGDTLLAAVNSDYFLNYYSRNLVAGSGVVELFRYDGTLLLSTDPKRQPGLRDNSPLLSRFLASDDLGHGEQVLEDGRAVLTAYRPSRNYPLVIVVHLDRENGLEAWRQEAVRTLFAVCGLLFSSLALAALYFLRMERLARQHDVDMNQLRLRSAALEAAANAIIITDPKGTIEWANPAFCTLSGYTMEETLGCNPGALIKSGVQSAADYQDLWRTILSGEVWRGEMVNRRKDGSIYPEDQTITPVRDADGEISHFIAVKQDITERRMAEKRMEALSHHLVLIQESARRRLAGELHDRTSPNLSAIGVHLDVLAAMLREGDSDKLASHLEDVRALVEDTTASIREISSDLRPPILDYAGLEAALESYVKQFQRRTGMVVRLECKAASRRLNPELESVLFRIVQESLTNCGKHSRAKTIGVSLDLESNPMNLNIVDDGIGFDPACLGKATHAAGLGILTMREMAEFSGGRCTVESVPGQGTRIGVAIPVPKGKA